MNGNGGDTDLEVGLGIEDNSVNVQNGNTITVSSSSTTGAVTANGGSASTTVSNSNTASQTASQSASQTATNENDNDNEVGSMADCNCSPLNAADNGDTTPTPTIIFALSDLLATPSHVVAGHRYQPGERGRDGSRDPTWKAAGTTESPICCRQLTISYFFFQNGSNPGTPAPNAVRCHCQLRDPVQGLQVHCVQARLRL